MATYLPSSSSVFSTLFSPVRAAYPGSQKRYNCTSLGDLDFIEAGLLRTLSSAKTGRDFLQHHGDAGRKDITVDHFFKALKSGRRLGNLRSVNSLLAPFLKSRCTDPFSSIPKWKWGQSTNRIISMEMGSVNKSHYFNVLEGIHVGHPI
ncbi:hypothetical protein OAF27_02205 [Verrucomicrobiales bacterium]|nr:hypothetical protein [Verrucomicrobiales bacterium]